MIKRIELKNYRVYDDFAMDFKALEMIQGRNGTGKTSIVEAIGFALFGSTLQRGKAGSWIKRGHRDGSVKLYIDDFVITRSSNLAIVELDGDIIARNNVGITAWVEKTYGLTADLYKTSFFIGQKDIGSFASLSPMERTKRVEKLLRIDQLDDIKEHTKMLARTAQSSLANYTAKLEGVKFSEDKIKSISNDLVNFEIELMEEENQLEKLLFKEGEYKSQITLWQEKLQLEKTFEGQYYDIDALAQEQKEILEYNAKVEEHNRLANEKMTLGKTLSSVNVLEKYFKYTIAQIMIHDKAFQLYKKLKNELVKLKAEPNKHDIKFFEAKLAVLQSQIQVAIDMPTVCPTCGQDWPEKNTVDVHKLIEDKEKMQDLLKILRAENRAYEITIQLLKPAMTEQEIEEAYTALKFKSASIRLDELAAVPTDRQEIKTTKINLPFCIEQNAKNKRLQELGPLNKPALVDLAPTRKSITGHKRAIKQWQAMLDEQTNARAIWNEFASLKDTEEETLIKLKSFIKFIDSYRRAFGTRVIPLLEKNVSNIVDYLTEGKYKTIRINSDYSIGDFEYYSGSEQDSINFALRLAIAQVSRLGSFKTMILDEIAASFDSQKEHLLIDVLKQQSNQLIYITHGDII